MEQVFRAISLELVDADSAFAARADAAANDAGRSWKPLGIMRGEVKRLGGMLDHVRCIGAVHAGWGSWREAVWGGVGAVAVWYRECSAGQTAKEAASDF